MHEQSSIDVAPLAIRLYSARAMLRAVIQAEAAVECGSINWGASECTCDRWSPVMGEVRQQLLSVQEIVSTTDVYSTINWWSPLRLVEALDAALWHGGSNFGTDLDQLDSDELVSVARVVISHLDAAMLACDEMVTSTLVETEQTQ